jgi:hypothetical protein
MQDAKLSGRSRPVQARAFAPREAR